MKVKLYKGDRSTLFLWLLINAGVAVNVVLAYITNLLGVPLFMDTIGTVVVACTGGILPGIFTALSTNILCMPFNTVSIYFAIVNIFIAIFSGYYQGKYSTRGFQYKIYFILAVGFFCGITSGLIQWVLFLRPQDAFISSSIEELSVATGLPYFVTFLIVNTLINLLDKGIVILIALNLLLLIPDDLKTKIKYGGWRQTPLTDEEIGEIRQWSKSSKGSMRFRFTVILTVVAIAAVTITIFQWGFNWRIILLIVGALILFLAFGMWMTSRYIVYPISRMGLEVDSFIQAGDDQEKIDKVVKDLRKINIRTNDEVEKLYKSICDMALNQAEQIRSIRHFNERTTKMQDGLIITMADLVEKRDMNSGSHIQKTAAYVKIIAEGLQKKEYYASKVNSKFIADVVRSAPLHDIGKINIPDNILNKEGELTPEEEEIRRSHTSEGKKIMENAITTVSGENYLKEARNMAAYHHERWDGTGYPEGLHGEVIPLSARIMAVADQFDVLTASKENGKQFSFDEAVSLIEEGSGTLFDPKCVEVFMDSIPEIKVVYRKYNRIQG